MPEWFMARRKRQMTNYFITYSPYQMLLCFSLAAQYTKDRNVLFIGGGWQTMMKTYEVLSSLAPGITFKMIPLCSDKRESNLQKFFSNHKCFNVIKNNISENSSAARVFYSCEWNVRTAYLAHVMSQMSPLPEFYFVEDGIASYVQKKLKTKSCLENIADKIVYGSWHKDCEKQGDLNHSAYICAVRPELLANLYQHHRCIKIQCANLLEMIGEAAIPQEISGVAPGIKIAAIIALDSKRGGFSPQYINAVKNCVEESIGKDDFVAIKRHPADIDDEDLLSAFKLDCNYIELPPELPIELYFLCYSNTLKLVVGGLGTAVFSAKWLVPCAAVKSLISTTSITLTPDYAEYSKMFKQIDVGITVIDE